MSRWANKMLKLNKGKNDCNETTGAMLTDIMDNSFLVDSSCLKMPDLSILVSFQHRTLNNMDSKLKFIFDQFKNICLALVTGLNKDICAC